MRNLKRALSLTLASVMLLGMMVVGTSAAESYPDVSEKENIEAIEVLQEVGVMTGDNNGNFNPDDYVTREQMAVIMSQLLKLNYDYYEGTNPFSDVPAWAAKYVAACAANGITSGIGGGMYGAGQNVNAVQAALMMLKALGYFQYQEDFGDSYILATVKQATETGLFDMIDSRADQALTRNEVAQMALNALKSDMVSFTGDVGTKIPTSDGREIVVGYKAEYTPRTSTLTKYQAIEKRSSDVGGNNNLNRGQYYIQLGEELYDGDLRLNDNAVDDFGRPSRTWEYKGETIGTYMKKELIKAEYTKGISGKDLYTLLGADTIKNYDFDITIDGVTVGEKTGVTENDKVLTENAKSFFDETYMTKTYNNTIGKTGKGVLTQVFVNFDTEEVDIAVINTYLAKAASDYNEKKDEAKLDVYGLDKTSGADKDTVWYKEPEDCSEKDKESKSISVTSEDFAIAADIKADDFFLVTAANGEIKSLVAPEIISAATLTEFSKDSYVVGDSSKYEYNTTIEYDPETLDAYTGEGSSAIQQLKDTEYNLYLDAYGYLIGVEIVEAVNNYIFLTGIDQGTSNLKNKTSEAAGILLDGTFIEFKMNMNDSRKADDTVFTGHPLVNTWCTYTVNSDGIYTLKQVKGTIDTDHGVKVAQTHDTDYMDKTIDHKHVSLKGGTGYTYVYGNDDTVYIVPELSAVASDTELAQYSVNVPKYASNNDANDTKAPLSSGGIEVKDNVGIISGVSSVTVGIDNVDLRTWTLAEIQEQDDGKLGLNNDSTSKVDHVLPGNVYTLYNKDGYVIAAIVLGEDNGSTKNLVYSHKSSIESEKYSKADDEWTWTRKVIFNGEEITLTQTGDDADRLKGIYGMTQNTWYEINLKADGTVKDVKHAYYTESGKHAGATPASPTALGKAVLDTTPGDFVDDITALEYTVTDGKNDTTTLYEQVWEHLTKAPSLQGSTLYVDTANKRGFYVNKSNIKSVLIQTNNDKTDTTYYDTIGELEDILDDLNVIDDEYNFKISAILTDGRATVVIIHDWNATAGQKNEKPVETTGAYASVVDEATAKKLISGDTDPLNLKNAEINSADKLVLSGHVSTQNVKEQGNDALEALGYTVKKVVTGTNKWTYTVEKNGREEEIELLADYSDKSDATKYTLGTEYVMVTIDGVKNYVAVDGTIAVSAPTNNPGTGYIIKKTGDSAYAYGGAYGNYTALTKKDADIKTGYVLIKADNANVKVTASGFDAATFKVGSETTSQALSATSYAPAGSTITFTLKVAAAADIDLNNTNAAKVETTNNSDATNGVTASAPIACSKASVVDTTTAPTATLLTFTKAAGDKLEKGVDTITVTYTLANKDLVTEIKFTPAS